MSYCPYRQSFRKMAMKLTVNGNEVEVTSEADTPLLWVLDELNRWYQVWLRYCPVWGLHGASRRASDPILRDTRVSGREQGRLRPLKVRLQRRACRRYSRHGWRPMSRNVWILPIRQIMAATALWHRTRTPVTPRSTRQWQEHCRCGTYPRIRKVHLAASLMAEEQSA